MSVIPPETDLEKIVWIFEYIIQMGSLRRRYKCEKFLHIWYLKSWSWGRSPWEKNIKRNEDWISPVDLQHLEVESRGRASKGEWDWAANEARRKSAMCDIVEAKKEKCLQKKEALKKEGLNYAECTWEIE